MTSTPPIALDQLADNLERLLLRYEELQKANALLEEQLTQTTQERDTLRLKLNAARLRLDSILERMPAPAQDEQPSTPSLTEGSLHHDDITPSNQTA